MINYYWYIFRIFILNSLQEFGYGLYVNNFKGNRLKFVSLLGYRQMEEYLRKDVKVFIFWEEIKGNNSLYCLDSFLDKIWLRIEGKYLCLELRFVK